MAFFCRQSLSCSSDGQTCYRYHDSDYIAFTKGWAKPVNITEATDQCSNWAVSNPNYSAIDGIMTYSSGSNTLSTLFDTYFAFDPIVFEIMVGSVLVAYALGHSTGAIIKLMGRT